MENMQFEYFASANWNTLFEGGCKGGRGPGGGAFLFFGKSRLGEWFEGGCK